MPSFNDSDYHTFILLIIHRRICNQAIVGAIVKGGVKGFESHLKMLMLQNVIKFCGGIDTSMVF